MVEITREMLNSLNLDFVAKSKSAIKTILREVINKLTQIKAGIIPDFRKVIYDVTIQWQEYNLDDSSIKLGVEMIITELKKIFVDSSISLDEVEITDVYSRINKHNIIIVDWG